MRHPASNDQCSRHHITDSTISSPHTHARFLDTPLPTGILPYSNTRLPCRRLIHRTCVEGRSLLNNFAIWRVWKIRIESNSAKPSAKSLRKKGL